MDYRGKRLVKELGIVRAQRYQSTGEGGDIWKLDIWKKNIIS